MVKFKLYYINYKKLIYINFNEVKKTNLGKNNQFLTFQEHLFHTESIQIPERLLEQKPLVSKLYSLLKTMKYQRDLVSRIGFEPMTPSLKGKCSTN